MKWCSGNWIKAWHYRISEGLLRYIKTGKNTESNKLRGAVNEQNSWVILHRRCASDSIHWKSYFIPRPRSTVVYGCATTTCGYLWDGESRWGDRGIVLHSRSEILRPFCYGSSKIPSSQKLCGKEDQMCWYNDGAQNVPFDHRKQIRYYIMRIFFTASCPIATYHLFEYFK